MRISQASCFHTNARHSFWVFICKSFVRPGHRSMWTAGPQWKISVKLSFLKTLPRRESNQESATYQSRTKNSTNWAVLPPPLIAAETYFLMSCLSIHFVVICLSQRYLFWLRMKTGKSSMIWPIFQIAWTIKPYYELKLTREIVCYNILEKSYFSVRRIDHFVLISHSFLSSLRPN